MLALLQRVSHASVTVDQQVIATIKQGIMVLFAVEQHDTPQQAKRLAARLLGYRIFADGKGKMNLSVTDIKGELLIVPQFTLAADTKKGLRPSFSPAADPELGAELFNYFVKQLQQSYCKISAGEFGANMQVKLCNDGPVTIMLHC